MLTKQITAVLILFSLSLFVFTGCNDEPECTEEFKMINLEVIDQDGNPVLLDFFLTIRSINGDTVSCFHEYAQQQLGFYVVLADYTYYPETVDNIVEHNHVSALENRVESFTFIGEIGDTIVISEEYTFSSDGCHIHKVNGKDLVELDL